MKGGHLSWGAAWKCRIVVFLSFDVISVRQIPRTSGFYSYKKQNYSQSQVCQLSLIFKGGAETWIPGWINEKCLWKAVHGLLCYCEALKIMEKKLLLANVERQHFNQNIIFAFQFDRLTFILVLCPTYLYFILWQIFINYICLIS